MKRLFYTTVERLKSKKENILTFISFWRNLKIQQPNERSRIRLLLKKGERCICCSYFFLLFHLILFFLCILGMVMYAPIILSGC